MSVSPTAQEAKSRLQAKPFSGGVTSSERLRAKLAELLPLTLLLCVALVFSTAYLNAYSDIKYPYVALGVVLLPAALARLVCHREQLLRSGGLLYALSSLGLLLWALADLVYVINLFESLKGVLFLAGGVGLGFSSAFLVRNPRRFARLLVWLFAFLVALASAYASAQRLRIDFVQVQIVDELWKLYPGKYLASFFGSGPLGAQFLVQGLFVLAGGLFAFRGKARWLLAGCLAWGCAYLFMSQSRAAYAAFIPALLVFTTWAVLRDLRRHRRRAKWVIPAACVLAFGIVLAGYYGGIRQRLWLTPGSVQAKSTNYRWYTWQDTVQMIRSFPVNGVGYWNYDIVIPRFASEKLLQQQSMTFANERVNRAHNDYLDITAELGAVGALFFALLLGSLAWAGARLLRHDDPVGAGAACSLLGVGVNALFDFPLYNPVPAACFWLLGGLVIALAREHSKPLRSPHAPAPPQASALRVAAVALLTIAAATALLPWYRYVVSQSFNRLGDNFVRTRDLETALLALAVSQRVAPDNRETYVLLSAVLRNSGNFSTAEAVARKWIRLEPHFSLSHNALGYALGSQGKQDEALQAFRRALALAPTNASAAINAATILYLKQDYKAAFELYRQGFSIDPVFARDSLRNYLDSALECGYFDEAQALLAKYEKLYPKDEEIVMKWREVRILRKGIKPPRPRK